MKCFLMYCLVTAFVTANFVAAADDSSTLPDSGRTAEGSTKEQSPQPGPSTKERRSKESGSEQQTGAAQRGNGQNAKRRAKQAESTDKSQQAAIRDLLQRFTSVEAQLTEIVLMVNRNASDLKAVQTQMNEQLITGSVSAIESKQQIEQIDSRLTQQTIQANKSLQHLAKNVGDLQAQLAHHIVAVNDKNVTDSDEKDRRLSNIEALIAHQTIAGSESTQQTGRQVADVEAQLSHQLFATIEDKRRLESLDARLVQQTITGSESAQQLGKLLASLEAQLNHQVVAASEQSQDNGGVVTTAAQQIDGSGDKPVNAIRQVVHTNGSDAKNTPERLHPSGNPIPQSAIETKLDRIIELLERQLAK